MGNKKKSIQSELFIDWIWMPENEDVPHMQAYDL